MRKRFCIPENFQNRKRNARHQDEDGKIIEEKQRNAAFQVEKEKLLRVKEILGKSAEGEGLDAVERNEDHRNPGDSFCNGIPEQGNPMEKHPRVERKVNRDEGKVPMACDEMRCSGEGEAEIDIEDFRRKDDAACDEKNPGG